MMGERVPSGHQPQTHKTRKPVTRNQNLSLFIIYLLPSNQMSFSSTPVVATPTTRDGRLLLRWLTPRIRKNKHQPHLFFCIDSKSGNSFPHLSLTWSGRPL